MLETFENRLKAIEDKINEIAFVLSSNELYMKVPVSPLTSIQQSSEEQEDEEKEEPTQKQEPSVEDEDDEEDEEPSENPDEIHDPEDEDD